MPRRCVVLGCLTKGSIPNNNKSFYRFPSDLQQCKKWLKALCNLQLVKLYETHGHLHLNKNKFVCSDHFEDKFMRNVKAPSQGLFEGAVPSLNINLNMDALISSLKQSDILNEISKPKPLNKKPINVPLKRPKEKIPQLTNEDKSKSVTIESKLISQGVDKSKILINGNNILRTKGDDSKVITSKNKLLTGEQKPVEKGKPLMEKSKVSPDDIPLKELFAGKIKIEPNSDANKQKHKYPHRKSTDDSFKLIKKHKKKKVRMEKPFKRKKKDKLKKCPNRIEQVFLPARKLLCDNEYKSTVQDTYESNVTINDDSLIVHVKKEKIINEVNDPLGNINSQSIGHAPRPVKNKKKVKKTLRRKNRIVKKKKVLIKSATKKLIKVVVAPKTMNDKDLRISTQGPKKIIKVVVPAGKNTADGSNVGQGQNKIIKVVVPKKTANGKEINLEKDEINKILRLVSAPKRVDSKGIKLITQSAEVNRILKLASVTNNAQGNLINANLGNNENVKEPSKCVDGGSKILRKIPPPKNIDGKEIKLIASSSKNGKILKPIPPPKTADGQVIKLIAKNLEETNICNMNRLECSNKTIDNISVTNNAPNDDAVKDSKTNVMPVTSHSKESENSFDDFEDTPCSPDNRADSPFSRADSPNEMSSNPFESLNVSDVKLVECTEKPKEVTDKDKSQSVEMSTEDSKSQKSLNISKDTVPLNPVNKVEVNPITEELCKRIKYMIDQRFAENNADSSDSDSGEMNIPLIHITKPQKSIKQIVDSYRGETKCSCETIYQEKMKSLYQEEKDLKRQLKNVQKYVFHYKDNIRKRTALISDLRKQIPVKKPPKTGQLIKTVIPLDKIKEKNPGTYRFTKNLKTFALDLFYSSPLSYNILEKMYFLPSRKTLKNWLTNPKNTSVDLLDDNNDPIQENLESVERDNGDVLNESSRMMGRNPEPIHHHTHNMETLESNMNSMEDNIEPLHENMDEIMFRNDLAAAIMNT